MIGEIDILNALNRRNPCGLWSLFSQNIRFGAIFAGGAARLGSRFCLLSTPLSNSFKYFCDKMSVANAIGGALSYSFLKGK